jgi:uncharacterized protein YqeY
MLEAKLEQDIKAAMLTGDSSKVSTLRGVKAALLNLKVATNKRDSGLNDDEVISVFAKESKQRQESADLYKQGGNQEKANAELQEKVIIDEYLPAQLSDDELSEIIDKVIAQNPSDSASAMGQIIGKVKSEVGVTADGSKIAQMVKGKLL